MRHQCSLNSNELGFATVTDMRMSQSLVQLERAFENEILREQRRRQYLRKDVATRSRTRRRLRIAKHGKLRFVGLMLAIVTTAVLVTVAMFETLAWLLS